MLVPTIMGPSLRPVLRTIHRVSKHGLYMPRRQESQLVRFVPLDKKNSLKRRDEDNQRRDKDNHPHASSEFEQFISLEAPTLPAMNSFRKTPYDQPAQFGPPGTLPGRHGRYWQTDPQANYSHISYYKDRSSAPLVVSRGWLRDACTCEICVDPSSGQKNFVSTDIPLKLDISSLTTTLEGELLVRWENDFLTGGTHVSQYPAILWNKMKYKKAMIEPRIWSARTLTDASPYYSYPSFMADGPEYRQAMFALSQLGIIFLRDVPSSEETVKDIARRLGFIQETFYGTTWDVISKPNAENVAYTNSYLGLHQDLLYMSNVPRIQILHCLKNTCEGGESIFSDGYLAAYVYSKTNPDGVKALTDRQVVYHYNKGGHLYRAERPVLSDLGLGSGSSKLGVYWSPPFQSPDQADERTPEGMIAYKRWHKGTRRLKNILEHHDSVYEHKMQPGECVIFDNRRVTHGRRAFDTSSGERWLKGTYVENDSFNSRLRSLKLSSSPGEIQ